MTLYLRQHVLTIGDRFSVLDENGEDRWFVEQELLRLGKTLWIYDRNEQEAACVQREILTLLPTFTVQIGEEEAAQIVKHFTLFFQEYSVDGPGWRVEGEFLSHEFTVWDGERQAVKVYKEWLSWGDCYTIEIDRPEEELLALAVVLAIDCANESN